MSKLKRKSYNNSIFNFIIMKSRRIKLKTYEEIKNAYKILIVKIQRTKPLRRPRGESVKLKETIQQLHDVAGEIRLSQDNMDREPHVTQ